MPILPPALDDRTFDDLVAEAVSRIPAHTPEWTHPRVGDPGRTLIDLFAWLTDTLLYRANLIPERQRLAFLRLLGIPMRGATAARGLVSLGIDDDTNSDALSLRPFATVTGQGPVSFETLTEVTVLPVTAEAYYKRSLTAEEDATLSAVIDGLRQIYELPAARPYVTTPVFADGAAEPAGFDLVTRTVDRSLWLALLAPDKDLLERVRTTLGAGAAGRQQLLNVGVMPVLEPPEPLDEDVGPRPGIAHVWEISADIDGRGEPVYHRLEPIADSSAGLTRRGVLRLALPAREFIRAPLNDVRLDVRAGVGTRPPRLDAPEKAERLVAWVRLRPDPAVRPPAQSLALSWVGINAVEIDQRQTVADRVIGESDGSADQQLQLPGQSVELETLEIQVEETQRGYVGWQRVEELALLPRDAALARDMAVFSADPEAGTIRFGDGVRGRIPEDRRRVRVKRMRTGGGRAGNLPPGSLKNVNALDLTGNPVATKLVVTQSLPTSGGEDQETLAEAERRIPALFRHRDRAVTEDDYRHLAAGTPGVHMGRVELLPRFKPQQRRSNVPGVVSVLVLPDKAGTTTPAPRPDRHFLESVHAHLSARRPIATELYVIGCEYVPLAVGVGIAVRDGFDHDGVILAVREALRHFLWPLRPGGIDGTGWQLGRAVRDRELEVTVARVSGVSSVIGVNLFRKQNGGWTALTRAESNATVAVELQRWQLPELLAVTVIADGTAVPLDLDGSTDVSVAAGDDGAGNAADFAVPVVPEVC